MVKYIIVQKSNGRLPDRFKNMSWKNRKMAQKYLDTRAFRNLYKIIYV